MKAMILAAGLGTRLRPLTDELPKALVEVGGRTMLELTLTRLRVCGVREVIVNVHYFGDMIIEYLKTNDDFGMRIAVSREHVLLDTGGGLKRAAHFFLEDSGDREQPFILHNVDVLSTIDLGRMVAFHRECGALATLAVQDRESTRNLLFDEHGELCGRQSPREPAIKMVRPADKVQTRAFTGIHVISQRLLSKLGEGIFSIIASYLDLAAEGEKVVAFDAGDAYWRDLGKPESVAQAAEDLKQIASLQEALRA